MTLFLKKSLVFGRFLIETPFFSLFFSEKNTGRIVGWGFDP
jgi:hypothetical protein